MMQVNEPRMVAEVPAVFGCYERALATNDVATQHGRHGHRRITALLHAEGWCRNHKRVECLRLRPERLNHVSA